MKKKIPAKQVSDKAKKEELLKKAYQISEQKILVVAKTKLNIYDKTKENAEILLSPIFSKIAGKTVEITFK